MWDGIRKSIEDTQYAIKDVYTGARKYKKDLSFLKAYYGIFSNYKNNCTVDSKCKIVEHATFSNRFVNYLASINFDKGDLEGLRTKFSEFVDELERDPPKEWQNRNSVVDDDEETDNNEETDGGGGSFRRIRTKSKHISSSSKKPSKRAKKNTRAKRRRRRTNAH